MNLKGLLTPVEIKVHVCAWTCYMYTTCTHTHIHIYTHTHTYTHTHCIHVHIFTHAHTHTHVMDTHTYTHTYIHTQDLHQFFPHLLSNIFGFDRSGGWGLSTFSQKLHSDFPLVYQFLAPGGDLFQLISKLEGEDFLYEFPTSCLPVRMSVCPFSCL